MTLIGMDPKDRDGIERLLDDGIGLSYDGEGLQHMILNGSDMTEGIRTPEMSQVASRIPSSQRQAFSWILRRDMAKRYNQRDDG